MKISKIVICTLVALVLTVEDVVVAEDTPIPAKESGELYLPSDDAMADVSNALNAARESNKLALVVIGANWCHDSRALASRLYQEQLNTLIDERYETVFVDVGYLEKGKDVISSIGPPVEGLQGRRKAGAFRGLLERSSRLPHAGSPGP